MITMTNGLKLRLEPTCGGLTIELDTFSGEGFRRVIEITSRRGGIFAKGNEPQTTINWSACGAQTIADADRFAQGLSLASALAEVLETHLDVTLATVGMAEQWMGKQHAEAESKEAKLVAITEYRKNRDSRIIALAEQVPNLRRLFNGATFVESY